MKCHEDKKPKKKFIAFGINDAIKRLRGLDKALNRYFKLTNKTK